MTTTKAVPLKLRPRGQVLLSAGGVRLDLALDAVVDPSAMAREVRLAVEAEGPVRAALHLLVNLVVRQYLVPYSVS